MAASTSPIRLSFEDVYDIIKNNRQDQFDKAYGALLTRPDYLSAIPEKEGYAIFHYLVVHGALELFNKVLTIPNLRFNIRMRTATKPAKDILDIATENRKKSPIYNKLYDTIHDIIQMDKFVQYAKQQQIKECKDMLELNDELANQKPPYRQFYLIHHLAYDNNKDAIDQFRNMCQLNWTLLTNDHKTAAEVAFEQQHKELGAYLESLSPEMRAIREKHEKERNTQQKEQSNSDAKVEAKIIQAGGQNLLGTFTCPLTKEVFRDPVVLCDGFTYEREAIQQWLDIGNRRSPMTNIELASTELVSNMMIKQIIGELSSK